MFVVSLTLFWLSPLKFRDFSFLPRSFAAFLYRKERKMQKLMREKKRQEMFMNIKKSFFLSYDRGTESLFPPTGTLFIFPLFWGFIRVCLYIVQGRCCFVMLSIITQLIKRGYYRRMCCNILGGNYSIRRCHWKSICRETHDIWIQKQNNKTKQK